MFTTPAIRAVLGAALIATAAAAHAQPSGVKISEWMYNGDEFVEFTNFGPSPVDFTGWSYDDDSRLPFTFSLSAFGVVAPGESVILAERSAADFSAEWGLGAGVKVIGNLNVNLGRADEINLFDASGALVDRLTYGDNTVGGPRTLNVSGIPGSAAVIGANQVTGWVLSALGDGQGSYASASGFLGSPGFSPYAAPIPEPASIALMLAGLGAVGAAARRRRV
ncbi:MAG: lamin tail domain-containing protein [Rubrivivax sp.]|nr:lamin tail domain-containing protein [Rubrivivax sp.]